MQTHLTHALQKNHLQISAEAQTRLLAYLNLLQKWNKVFNLTAIRDSDEMILLHVLDSLSINPFLKGEHVLDVGSGAGLPGIPLALTNPTKNFFLLDSQNKKVRFLQQVKLELNLNNVEIIHARVEDFHREPHFDSILSRAFGSLKEMLLKTQHLAGPETYFLAMKGKIPETELAEISIQLIGDFRVKNVHRLTISGLNAERCVVILKRET